MSDSAAMSGPHPTISAWTRDDETGQYTADLHDFTLHVTWTPNTKKERGFFAWRIEKDGEETATCVEKYEEIEVAMAAAEAELPV